MRACIVCSNTVYPLHDTLYGVVCADCWKGYNPGPVYHLSPWTGKPVKGQERCATVARLLGVTCPPGWERLPAYVGQ